MANEITNLLPFRQYDDNDVVNMFAYNGTNVGAGLVVKVSAGDLNGDLVSLTAGGFLNVQGNAYSPTMVNPLKVTAGTSGTMNLGILLRDVRDEDENGEKLRFYPQKREELQCVLSGQSVPVATKGIFTFTSGAFTGGVLPALNAKLSVFDNGLLSTNATALQPIIGTVLATGSRTGGGAETAGNYAVVKIDF